MNQKQIDKAEFIRRVIIRAPKHLKPNASYVYSVLNGKVLSPRIDYVALFAEILECPIDSLMGDQPCTGAVT